MSQVITIEITGWIKYLQMKSQDESDNNTWNHRISQVITRVITELNVNYKISQIITR